MDYMAHPMRRQNVFEARVEYRTINPLEWKSSDPMRIVITLLYCLFAITTVKADVLWPVVPYIEFTHCFDGSEGRCSASADYKAGPTQFAIQHETANPVPGSLTNILAYGVHCAEGSKSGEFRYCEWKLPGDAHSPAKTTTCRLVSNKSWELTGNSTCMFTTPYYGTHAGAAAGSECIIFGLNNGTGVRPLAIQTPQGYLTALQVANAGDTYCLKPLPPDAPCDLVIIDDGVLDHGIVAPDSTSKRSIDLYMNCGDSPKFSLQGINGNKVTLGTGVTANITTSLVNKNQATLTSVLTTTNAQPGNYRATFVLIVSPN